MPVIKETIKQNNLDVTLKINLGSGINLSGFQQEIDNLTELTKDELINPIIDNEVRRFQYKSENGAVNLTFYFSNTPQPLFSHAGFSPSEIIVGSPIITNSFFIMDYYDTYDSYTQTKIFSTYLTQILSGVNKQPNYKIYSDTVNQFYSWYVPKWYVDAQIRKHGENNTLLLVVEVFIVLHTFMEQYIMTIMIVIAIMYKMLPMDF